MKIFSNKLYFFFFSLLFSFLIYTNVFAVNSNYNVSLVYEDSFNAFIERNEEKINNIRAYVENVGSFCQGSTCMTVSNGNFILKYQFFDSENWRVYVVQPLEIYSFYNENDSNNRYVKMYPNIQISYDVVFSGNEIVSFTRYGTGGDIFQYNFGDNNPLENDTILEINNYYYDTYFTNNSLSFRFIEDRGAFQRVYGTNIPIKSMVNETIYYPNNSINVNDFFGSFYVPTNPEPNLSAPPYNTYFNGYTETTFMIDNYTEESNANGYYIRLINNTNGNIQGIVPKLNEPYQEVVITSYENTNYTIQIYDREYNIIQEYSINANITYSNENFNVEITNVDNNTKEIFYKYIISDNTQEYSCFHSINNNEFIQDLNCTDSSIVYYNLTMSNNGNVRFKIEDNNGNIVYEYNQNFIFNVSETYISFQDNFENNYLNLNVLINRYQSNDIVEYSINGSTFIQANLEDYSTTQNIKNFYVNNLNNNDILNVRVKRNNNIITYATYKANYLKNNTSSNSDFNLNNFFDKLNINNINLNLRNYIIQIGNIFINSKLGNLIILEFFIMVVCWVLKTIRK